ncbi:hypothetical protein [Catellatospora sp. NPDC049609]|uniref:hypothetical protein n=1 Tax=Catellatospora sp. NPDC049609 TaxID=3155505 RepID=UPI003447AF6A
MTHHDALVSLLLGVEAEVDQDGWDARPSLLILKTRAGMINAEVAPLPEEIADAADYVEHLATAVGISPTFRARFVAGLGPNILGLGLVTEAWAVSDPQAVKDVQRSRRVRPISHHPRRQELRIVSAAVPERDLCVQRIRGGVPTLFYDSADSAIGRRIEGRVPESLRTLLNVVRSISLN